MTEPKPKYKTRSRIYIVEDGKRVHSCAQRYATDAFRLRDLHWPNASVMLDGKLLARVANKQHRIVDNMGITIEKKGEQ